MPCFSSSVGFAVATFIPLYICIESAEIISPESLFASSTERAVLPEAVGPHTTTINCLSITQLLLKKRSILYFEREVITGLPCGQKRIVLSFITLSASACNSRISVSSCAFIADLQAIV